MRTVWASEFDRPDLNALFSQWTASRLFKPGDGFGPCCTMGVFDGETLVASLVLHNWDRDAGVIEMSCASDTRAWLKRHVLREMFAVPFERIGVQTICFRVAADNCGGGARGIQRTLRAYGCAETRLPNLRGKGRDDILFTLTDDAWRANGFN